MSDCDTPRTDEVDLFCDNLGVMDAIEYAIYHGQKLELELNGANERINLLEEELKEAYSEMRKQHPHIHALFHPAVWLRAKEANPCMFSSKECDNPQEIIDTLNKNFGDLV